jgi:hypothetical protein
MLFWLSCWIAAVDPHILRRCPTTDKMWATQLGAWLLLSFCIAFITTLHATSCMPMLQGNLPLQIVVAALIASTIFLFDRALYQSDWFRHGYFDHDGPVAGRNRKGMVEKIVRVAGRLAISFGLAFSLSIFLELAIFSDSIADRLAQEHRRVNAPHLAKIERFRKEQKEELANHRRGIAALQRDVLAVLQTREGDAGPADPRLHDIAQQQERLSAREKQLAQDIRAKEKEVSDRRLEAVCESEGTKLDRGRPNRCSGVPRCGPRCRTALQLQKVHEEELQALQAKMDAVEADARRLSLTKDKLIAEAKEDRSRRRAELEHRRRDLEAEIARRQAALVELETATPVRFRTYEQEIKQSPGYVELRDDPLMRLRALEMLKADPDYGAVFTLYSWILKLFVMFLEVVPVLGKIFFAPPSAYAIHVQKQVEWHQRLDLQACEAEGQTGQQREQHDGRWWADPSGGTSQERAERRRHLTVASAAMGSPAK